MLPGRGICESGSLLQTLKRCKIYAWSGELYAALSAQGNHPEYNLDLIVTAINPAACGLRQHVAAPIAASNSDALSVDAALIYLANEALQTLSHMAMKRSRSRSEYSRHLAIAAFAVEQVRQLDALQGAGPTLSHLVTLGSDAVWDWAASLEVPSAGPAPLRAMLSSFAASQVRTRNDALVYLTDCTLATVEGLALSSNPPVRELFRHCSIAAVAVAACVAAGAVTSPRIAEILKSGSNVHSWAQAMRRGSNA